MLDFSELARVLGASWVEKMFFAFENRVKRVPRVWPGTQVQARKLAATYFNNQEDRDRFAVEVQRAAVEAWDVMTDADATRQPSSPFIFPKPRQPSLSQP